MSALQHVKALPLLTEKLRLVGAYSAVGGIPAVLIVGCALAKVSIIYSLIWLLSHGLQLTHALAITPTGPSTGADLIIDDTVLLSTLAGWPKEAFLAGAHATQAGPPARALHTISKTRKHKTRMQCTYNEVSPSGSGHNIKDLSIRDKNSWYMYYNLTNDWLCGLR